MKKNNLIKTYGEKGVAYINHSKKIEDHTKRIIESVRTKLNNDEAQLKQFRGINRQMGKGEISVATFYTALEQMFGADYTVKLTMELARVLSDEPKRLELLALRSKAKQAAMQQ